MNQIQEFVYKRTYSRWLPEEGRREEFPETVKRFISFIDDEIGEYVSAKDLKLAEKAINSLSVMPSMRTLWAAGDAARYDNTTMYNCSYVCIDSIRAFSEVLYILMCGTGVGFSVERKYIDKIPQINPEINSTDNGNVVVDDSREGWATALNEVLELLFMGVEPYVDYSKVRLKGARLLTMGGRASGPEPLKDLFDYLIAFFKDKRRRKNYKLQPIECLDVLNKIAEIVVVGGVRRSSQISLSDLNDRLIAEAKMGDFWTLYPHRSMSNNSAVYNGRPDMVTYIEEIMTLIKSRSGERGVFNREGALAHMTSNGRRKGYLDIGTNPCGEIILRDKEFCNLSEAVVRAEDTLDSLKAKVKIAVMFGVWQAMFTNFKYLSPEWKINCDEERLLGVSLTGIMDHEVLNNVNDTMKKWLGELKGVAIREAERWSKRCNINMPTAITCVKPSGTVSQLVNCASGIHPRYAKHYIRRYRISTNDPLFRLLRDEGIKCYPEVGQTIDTATTMVVEFPVNSPPKAITRHDYSAIDQLEHWKVVKEFWSEHNPSITVYVDDDEWLKVGGWMYDNFDYICGVSFLPKNNHTYQLAPYEEITEEEFNKIEANTPSIDFGKLKNYEKEDNTEGQQSYACVGDKCEI